jgi:CheY-like chemotaxis protein
MSHEIRTPMNAILGFTELLEGELRDDRQRQYLKSIRLSAISLLQLINDLLDMSQMEAGVMELRPEPTDLRGMCEFVHTVFAEPVKRKHLKLECQVVEDLPRALLLDRIRFRQILINLVGNAINFTDRGTVCVGVDWEREISSSHITVNVDIEDTGVGIPPDKLEFIFKPFVQVGTPHSKDKQGTVLGLAIVSRLIQAMGGTITATSVLGRGSIFHLRLPNIPISTRSPPSEEKQLDQEGDFDELEPSLVLVADDNEENRQLIAGMFSGSRHQLEFARDGLEAVSKARTLQPDIILLDIRMPGVDGREAFAQIRATPGLELMAIIAVTASAMIEDEATLRGRFNGYLRKPFSKRELFAEVSEFLPRRSKAGEARVPSSGLKGASPAAQELVRELRRLFAEEWPMIRDNLAINETKSFARKLQSLARNWSCGELAEYAEVLEHRAEVYEVVEIEEQVNDFPALVGRLSPPKPA